jgi:hypothetical protein
MIVVAVLAIVIGCAVPLRRSLNNRQDGYDWYYWLQ